MELFTIGELAKNPRTIQVGNIKNTIDQKHLKDDYLDYKNENIDYPYISAGLRLLSSTVIVHDANLAGLLMLKAKTMGQLKPSLIEKINSFQESTINKKIAELEEKDYQLALSLAPIVVAFESGTKNLIQLAQANQVTIEHMQVMLSRIANLWQKISDIRQTNLLTYSKNQAICGIMDWITQDSLIEINATPKKNISMKNVRKNLYYYYLVSRQQEWDIKYLAVYNPRWDIISSGPVDEISANLLNKISHRLDALDQMANGGLMSRLK